MHNLVIDIGNTSTKTAFFKNRQLEDVATTADLNFDVLDKYIENQKINAVILSSVRREEIELKDYLSPVIKYFRFDRQLAEKHIVNTYKTPETLGLDRLAAAIGAETLYPEKNVLIIDAGTCITYDLVQSDRKYNGGSISPGIAMRFKALNKFTSSLPLIEFDEGFNSYFGDDTRSAILSGVQQGIYNEAIGFINAYTEKYPNLHIVLCGGDAMFFDSRLKNSIFAHSFKTEPNLVLIGLNEVIYQHND